MCPATPHASPSLQERNDLTGRGDAQSNFPLYLAQKAKDPGVQAPLVTDSSSENVFTNKYYINNWVSARYSVGETFVPQVHTKVV